MAPYRTFRNDRPSKPLTQAQFDRRCDWLAEQLIAIDADVIGFQELWDANAVGLVFSHPELAAMNYQLSHR